MIDLNPYWFFPDPNRNILLSVRFYACRKQNAITANRFVPLAFRNLTDSMHCVPPLNLDVFSSYLIDQGSSWNETGIKWYGFQASLSGLFAYHNALKAYQSYTTTFNNLRFKFRFNGTPCGFGSFFRRSAVFPYKLHLSQFRHSLMGDLLFDKTSHSFVPSIKNVPERKIGKLHRASCDSLPSKSACNFEGAGSDGLRVISGLANRLPLWFRLERGVPV